MTAWPRRASGSGESPPPAPSEGWVEVPASKALDRQGQPLLIKLKAKVEAFHRQTELAWSRKGSSRQPALRP